MAKPESTGKPTLFDMVRKAFGKDGPEAGAEAVKIQKINARRVNEQELQGQIRALLADRDYARVGRLHIIGLERMRDSFGDRWGRVAPKGLQIAEGVLKSHLTRSDIVVAMGNLGFLILFTKLTKKQADIKAAMIAAEVSNRLMGGIENAEDVSTILVTETADGEVIYEEKSVMEVARDLIADETTAADDPTANRDPNDPSWRDIGSMAARPEGPVDAGGPEAHSGPVATIADAAFVYQPIWDVRHKVLSTYRCLPVATNPLGQAVSGYDVISGYGAEEVYPELDLMTLQTIAEALEDLHSRERRVLMVSPVHYRTLLRISEFTKLKMLRQSMAASLSRDLIFELMGMPDVTSERSVLELVSALKTMGRSVVVPARLNRTQFEELGARGFDTVAANISDANGGEEQIMRMMDTFVDGASKVGLRTVARGLETLSLATLAVAAGFDYVEGRAVHEPVENPEHVFRFQSEDLFAKLMGLDPRPARISD